MSAPTKRMHREILVFVIVLLVCALIIRAAQKAGIKKISHIDYHSTSILGIFAKFTVYVYGE